MEARIIYPSRKKIFRLIIYSTIFICIGCWMLIFQPQTSNPVFNQPFIKYSAAILGLAMGFAGIIFFSKKLRDNNPVMELTDAGVTDYSSAVAAGFIPWSDIKKIEKVSVSGQKFLRIDVFNPQEYIDRQQHSYKRKLMQANWKRYGSPIFFSPLIMQITLPELIQELNSRFNSFSKSTNS
jgi:hypothetical protein